MSKTTRHAGEMLAYTLNGKRPGFHDVPQLYLQLHTADPGADGNQAAHELAYPGYQRIAVPRADGARAAWRIDDNTATNLAAITFARYSGPIVQVRALSLGTAASGPGRVLRRMVLEGTGETLSPQQAPHFEPGDIQFSET